MSKKTLLQSIVGLAKIEKLEEDSFSNGSDAQKLLCEIQDQFEADGGWAGMIIDDTWIGHWNESTLEGRVEMLLSYVISEMKSSVAGELEV